MGKIIAIGGGSLSKDSNNFINEEIIRFSNLSNPNFLFIPTACSDDANYIQKMQEKFNALNVNFDTLLLIKEKPNYDQIKEKIESADIIYVGGGNTLMMMNRWRSLGVDKLLINAFDKDKVMCGVSAGSICWFKQGNSDSRKYKNSNASMIKVTGLGLVDALNCPHYDSEPERKPTLKQMMQKHKGGAIAIDDNCAIQIEDDKYRILANIDSANAYKVFWQNGKFNEEIVKKTTQFNHITQLLTKSV